MKTRTPEEGLTALTDDAERNRLLAEMAEQSTDMISRHTPEDWRFIYASPAVTHLLGYSVEEIVGMSAYDLYHPDDVEDFRLRAPTVNYDRGLYTHTYRFRHKDGHYTWLESTSRTIRDPDTNEIREILVVSRDATHRIKADKANRRLARVLESTQDLVIFVNLDFTISHLNEAARVALELEETDYSSSALAGFLTEKDARQLMQEGFSSASQTGYWRGELTMRSLKGGRIPVLLELLAHRSLHGDIEYFSLVAHDLTEKKAAEEQLKQYQADIDHASRLVTMGELASSLAHELNQPLSAMVNFLRGIERRFAGKESLAWSDIELPITRSIRTALRAGEIVHRMMDFTRKQEPVVTELNLAALIRDMIDFCESMADRHSVRLVFEIDHDLPLVLGDRIQLEQVLLNLIVNAIEASGSPAAEQFSTVRISVAKDKGRQLRVQVKDQGAGISEADMSRLFDRFFSTKQTGLGMGLAISRSLVENLGGELWADNLPEGGACFSFTLNIAD
ncbi:PAS domain-containing sensor histidine kinase [Marinobacter sp. HL-58]|uniref:PAS domain-containing sensor histidine kinase n=1 Tax=Marinobacter sp. HL-58 TaxID=1479237 RepID=UPI00055B4B3E|nr:PAS domain-containing sensor histidine kinase [Marinobacter sp. HL-58]KPP99400.1 MAG: PAS domain S-box [Marinobacter sp. HL-58]